MSKRQSQLERQLTQERFAGYPNWTHTTELLKEYLELKPDSELAQLALVEQALHWGDLDLAQTHLDTAKSKYPESADVIAMAVHVDALRGEVEAAMEQVKALPVRNSSEIKGFSLAFMTQHPAQRDDQSSSKLDLLSDTEASAAVTVKWLFRTLLHKAKLEALQGRLDEAIDTLEQLLEDASEAFRGYSVPVDNVYLNVIEEAYLHIPQLHFALGNLEEAVTTYRRCLQLPFGLRRDSRHNVLSSLGNLLLRFVPEGSFVAPSVSSTSSSSSSSGSGDVYIPDSAVAETLLLLRLHDESLRGDSSQPDELQHVQLYDGMALAYCSLFGAQDQLVATFEKALRQNYKDRSLWFQYALSLIHARRFKHALTVLKEAHLLLPKNASLCLFGARMCIDHVDEPAQALLFAQAGVRIGGPLKAQLQHVMAVAYVRLANMQHNHGERNRMLVLALQAFQQSEALHSKDYRLMYDMALMYANLRDLVNAFKYVRQTIKLNGDCVGAWKLLVLLLSARKEYEQSQEVLASTLERFPEHLELYLIKGHLQSAMEEDGVSKHSVLSFTEGLRQLKKLYGVKTSEDAPAIGVTGDDGNEEEEYVEAGDILSNLVDPVSGELLSKAHNPGLKRLIQRFWLAAMRAYTQMDLVEDALICLEEAAAIDDDSPELFYEVARTELQQNNHREAHKALNKALAVDVYHAPSMIQLGALILEQVVSARQSKMSKQAREENTEMERFLREMVDPLDELGVEYDEEMEEYGNDVQEEGGSVDGDDVSSDKSNQSVDSDGADRSLNEAVDMANEDRLVVAASYIKSALALDPMDSNGWYQLGLIKRHLGEAKQASEAFMTALQLEETEPVAPFAIPGEGYA